MNKALSFILGVSISLSQLHAEETTQDNALQEFKTKTCIELYEHNNLYKASDSLMMSSGKTLIGVLGLGGAILGTVFTLGAATPITLPLGIASIGVATSETVYYGYKTIKPAKQARRDKETFNLIMSLKSKEDCNDEKAFEKFYQNHFKTLEGRETFSKDNVANAILEMEASQKACELLNMKAVDDKIYFRFLSLAEVSKKIRENLAENSIDQ